MSSQPVRRRELLAALNQAMRDASGLGVLFSHAVAERLGVNSTDLECLDHIVARGPLTAGALAESTGLTTGAITGVIDRLERDGLARREPDPDDRRKVKVSASPDMAKRVAPYFAPMERRAMAVFDERDDGELELLLTFFRQSRDAALGALDDLRQMPARSAKPARVRAKRGARRSKPQS